MNIMFPLFISFILTVFITVFTKRIAERLAIVDYPDRYPERKIHSAPVPLLGGVAIIISFLISLFILLNLGLITDGRITESQVIGVIAASILIAIGGALDDKYNLRAHTQIILPVFAALVVVFSGVSIQYVTNPFVAGTGPFGRALLYFDQPIAGMLTVGSLLTVAWLIGMMYVTKLLDGLDGLVSGIGVIGAIILFMVSLYWDVPQSGTSILALILAGACAGFLIFNWHPAKVFLGESGALFIGFMLGVLSVISGAKIATALLIMGIPILDVVWVILRRLIKEKRTPFISDRKHLHFRLLDIGLSHRQAVFLLYFLTAIFGSSALFLQSRQKVIALGLVVVVMVAIAVTVVQLVKKKNRE